MYLFRIPQIGEERAEEISDIGQGDTFVFRQRTPASNAPSIGT
jgi:hypothetical protein